MSELISYKDAAKILGMTVQSLRNKVSAEGILCVREGNRTLFNKSMIENLNVDKSSVRIFVNLSREEVNALTDFFECIYKMDSRSVPEEIQKNLMLDSFEAMKAFKKIHQAIDSEIQEVKP